MCKKCIDTNIDTHIASLQIRSTALGQGLPSPANPLLNHPIRGSKLKLTRKAINANNDGGHYEKLVERQAKGENYDTLIRDYKSIPIGSTVEVQREDGGPWPQE